MFFDDTRKKMTLAEEESKKQWYVHILKRKVKLIS